jgi:hypothetical protein
MFCDTVNHEMRSPLSHAVEMVNNLLESNFCVQILEKLETVRSRV